MKKKWILILIPLLVVCIAVAAVGGNYAYQWLTGPLYQPGLVQAQINLRAPLDPPAQPVAPGFWQVEPDVRLHYFASGEGAPVLVVHGGPGYPFVKPWSGLELLKEQRRFYYYDQRGCGGSTRLFDRFPSTDSYYQNLQVLDQGLGLEAQIADIERIRRILGADKFTLVGQSFGGFLAALYAAEFPDHVESLVLVSPADMIVYPPKDGGLFPQIRARLPEAQRAGFDSFLKEYLNFQKIFSKSDSDLTALNNRMGDYYRQAYPYPASIEQGASGGWMVWAMYLGMGQHHDYRGEMKSTQFPVLIVHGADDLQPETESRAYLDIYPEAHFDVIPKAGHFAFEEQPEAFAQAVGDFLAGK
jgi:proline iminopeptidase